MARLTRLLFSRRLLTSRRSRCILPRAPLFFLFLFSWYINYPCSTLCPYLRYGLRFFILFRDDSSRLHTSNSTRKKDHIFLSNLRQTSHILSVFSFFFLFFVSSSLIRQRDSRRPVVLLLLCIHHRPPQSRSFLTFSFRWRRVTQLNL